MNKKQKNMVRSFALITQLGITIVTPVILCVALGIFIDSRCSTWFTLPLLILGVLSGGRSAWILAKKTIETDGKGEDDG